MPEKFLSVTVSRSIIELWWLFHYNNVMPRNEKLEVPRNFSILRKISYSFQSFGFTSFASMAEDSINTSLAVDIIAPKGSNLRISCLGQPNDLKSAQNKHPGSLSPCYLRASVGSCHDFCKYEGNMQLR
ncbi:hypothetical protein U1Q18_027898 [Sarracenia purpurea var. burkii]